MRLPALALALCAVPALAFAQNSSQAEQDLLRKMLEAMQQAAGGQQPPAETAPAPAPAPAPGPGTTAETAPAPSPAMTPAAPAAERGADGDIVDATDPARILAIAQGYGEATLEADNLGDPMISGAMEGRNYTVFFYGCENNANCTTLMFRAVFETSNFAVADMAGWNREQRFGMAYLDDDGYPTLQMDVNLYGGVTVLNLDDTFDWWRVVLAKFAERIGF